MNAAPDTLLQEPPARYTAVAPPDAAITGRIHVIRGQKVMLDRDLAELYGVETKHLKRQVRRNSTRFPEDFMFELTREEFDDWRGQFVTSNSGDWMGLRYAPMAFTEQGVAMLSSVLNSEQAILVNIHIMRVFTRMREVLLTQQELLRKLEQLETRADGHDVDIAAILRALRELTERPAPPRRPLGYKRNDP
ncbi:MAG: ORF6N domain-containing protein [Flavobacteriales bacterium]|nr:ORF6N domain-containing protein [Flavobacteriales bacterium]